MLAVVKVPVRARLVVGARQQRSEFALERLLQRSRQILLAPQPPHAGRRRVLPAQGQLGARQRRLAMHGLGRPRREGGEDRLRVLAVAIKRFLDAPLDPRARRPIGMRGVEGAQPRHADAARLKTDRRPFRRESLGRVRERARLRVAS
jgi:hypothetical protein